MHTATIYFGIKGKKYRIDGEESTRTRRQIRTDAFHPYFWEKRLLTDGSDLERNINNARQDLTLE
jgi:hypothetical protein